MRAPLSRSRPPFLPALAALASRGPSACRRPRPAGRARARRGASAARVAQTPVRLALQRRGAGGDLEQPQLLGGQRRLLVGVVLAAGEQAPEQDRELARGRDDRLAVAAAGARCARRSACSGPGWQTTLQAASTSAQRADAEPRLVIRPLRAGSLAGLADLRVQPEVGDQLARWSRTGGCRRSAARNVAAQITFTPGTVISRRISGRAQRLRAISRSTAAISASRNSMWRIAGCRPSRPPRPAARARAATCGP